MMIDNEVVSRDLVNERIVAAQNAALNDELDMWMREDAWDKMCYWRDVLDILDHGRQLGISCSCCADGM